MENQRLGGISFRRVASLRNLSSAHRTDPPTSPPRRSPGSASRPLHDYDDRQRAQRRYTEAAADLKEAIKRQQGLDFEDISSEPGFDDSRFIAKLNAILAAQESSINDRKGWSTFTHAVKCVFTALSPFAKNPLTVAKDAHAVPLFTSV